MRASVKTWWLQALRGGKYAQGAHQRWLATNSMCGTHTLFSPLGVLCDLYTIRRGDGEFSDPLAPGGVLTYKCDNGEESTLALPPSIRDWAGLEQTDPCAKRRTLMDLSLEGWSFNVIACIIEEHF